MAVSTKNAPQVSSVQPTAGQSLVGRSPNDAGVRPRVHMPANTTAAAISARSCTSVAEITRPGGPPVVTLPPPASTPAAISR